MMRSYYAALRIGPMTLRRGAREARDGIERESLRVRSYRLLKGRIGGRGRLGTWLVVFVVKPDSDLWRRHEAGGGLDDAWLGHCAHRTTGEARVPAREQTIRRRGRLRRVLYLRCA